MTSTKCSEKVANRFYVFKIFHCSCEEDERKKNVCRDDEYEAGEVKWRQLNSKDQ